MMGAGYYSNNEIFYKKCLGWELKFVFLPKTCSRTGKRIWLEYAYRGMAIYRAGDFESITEYQWHDKFEHIIWKLKQ
jgi:hypothetical protein